MAQKEYPQVDHSTTRRLRDGTCSNTVESASPIVSGTHIGRWLIVAALLFGLLTAQPVAAQEAAENPVCSDESGTLVNMIEGFIQLTTALGVVGLLVVWQADELTSMFTVDQERKQNLKRHKISAMKSAAILVLLGPLFTVGGSMMELPIAQCVDLIPF